MVKKLEIKTSTAYLIWALCLVGGFVFTGFKPMAQFATFALYLTTGLGMMTGKRLLQKRKEFKNNEVK